MRKIAASVIGLLVAAILFQLGAFTLQNIREAMSVPRQAYASDWTATFIIEHIRVTGEWPNGWDDLRDEYDRLAVPEHYAWSFDELTKLIDVEWNNSVDEIAKAKENQELITLTSGIRANFLGNPNERVRDFIHNGNDPYRVHSRIGESREQNGAPESP